MLFIVSIAAVVAMTSVPLSQMGNQELDDNG
jgi:hypothetical protein